VPNPDKPGKQIFRSCIYIFLSSVDTSQLNPKSEARITKQIQMTKISNPKRSTRELNNVLNIRFLNLGLVSDFDIRISYFFNIRISNDN
jgi:hypothetical protein